MTREEMIALIIQSIQTDEGLLDVLRFVVTNNINTSTPDSLPTQRLAALTQYLQQ